MHRLVVNLAPSATQTQTGRIIPSFKTVYEMTVTEGNAQQVHNPSRPFAPAQAQLVAHTESQA
jgi:hypothetical protein